MNRTVSVELVIVTALLLNSSGKVTVINHDVRQQRDDETIEDAINRVKGYLARRHCNIINVIVRKVTITTEAI